MISIKRYLEGNEPVETNALEPEDGGVLPALVAAYGSSMLAMGRCSFDACPSLGGDLKQRLCDINAKLSIDVSREAVEEIDRAIQEHLQAWSDRAAHYFRDRASEVKELLLAMARTAESVGSRDQRYASQISLVTARLRQISTLDDLAQIRASVEKGTAELKTSIERMTAEGKAAVDELRQQVRSYRAKLEDVEEQASRDSLTGVRNRSCVENIIQMRMATGSEFCIAILDIDNFKHVNDSYGHLAGDELLRLFAGELRSTCRATDVIGRWGGDEFIVIFDCDQNEANRRISRLCKWACGDYTVNMKDRALKLRVSASIGLADYRKDESMKSLIARADAAMYEQKALTRRDKKLAAPSAMRA